MIDVRELTYTYKGRTEPAVTSVSFRVERGEIFGFLGPSGAGKTTIQKVLIRLLRDYQGHVSILGKDLGSWDRDYYERVGISFELPNHYLKLTALENLNYFDRSTAARRKTRRACWISSALATTAASGSSSSPKACRCA